MLRFFTVILVGILFGTLTACQTLDTATPTPTPMDAVAVAVAATLKAQPTTTPTATPEPPRVLTVCSQEPASLFLFGDTSSAARSILQAIYDGPFDMLNYQLSPVILAKTPSLENGDVRLQPVEVPPGDLIVDAQGNWATLAEGLSYRPSECMDDACALTYEGQDPVQMDALVVQFQLLPGVRWSDGEALNASDSVYAFKVFQELFKPAAPEILRMTESYTAVDEFTVEWVGIPGYVGLAGTKFFPPLPEHLWGGFDYDFLLAADVSTRSPIGWGPYVIDEWTAGDHITLSRNPNYFLNSEGLPHFDYLVFRFMDSGDEAIDALVIGECDLIDRPLLTEADLPRLQNEQAAGRISFSVQTGTAWELAAFGIDTLNNERPDLFAPVGVRQAVAMCIDRQKIVDELLFGVSMVPDTYVPPIHPLYNGDVSQYVYDPQAAALLLSAAGWVDQDGNPGTPLTSLGIPDIPDGTPLSFTYLVPSDGERPAAAQIIKDGLEGCGIGVEVVTEDWDALMLSGPEGPLFGRQFDMAQFAWTASFEPACGLFMSSEIPGPPPDYPKGWGGGNLAGYSSPEYDSSCRQAMTTLPGSDAYLLAHDRAQEIFAEELPVLPLYQRIRLVAMRPDLCNLVVDPASNSALSHLELLDYGQFCESGN